MMDGAPTGPMEWSLFMWLLAGALTLAGMGLTSTITGISVAWRMRGMMDARDAAAAIALQGAKDAAETGVLDVRDESRASLQNAKDAWALELRAIVGELHDMKDEFVKQITDSRHDLRSEVFGRVLTMDSKLDALTRTVVEISTRALSTDQKVDVLTAQMTTHVTEDRAYFQTYGERLAKLEGPWAPPASAGNRKRS